MIIKLHITEEVTKTMGKRLVDPNRLCMGCMQEINRPAVVCPHCGFIVNQYQRPKNSLPLYEIVNGKYLIGKVLGIGGFGITYVGWDFYQSKKVCIKEYFPRQIATRNPDASSYTDQISVSIQYTLYEPAQYTANPSREQQAYLKGLEAYIKEAENLSKFYLMPGIVSVRDFFYGNRTAYIVMEYIDGINMKQYAKARGGRLMPDEVFFLLKDVLKALNEVHKKNIIHRDISPDNIMLTRERKAKLIDFGAAKDYENHEKVPVQLKQGYAPIEQYTRDGNQGPWSDVYSMCASIYYLLTGIRIPNAKERQVKDTVQLLQVLGVPVSEQQDLAIRKGLSLDARARYQTIAELYRDLYGEII
ncbi:MAG: serine/threonine protein kinase [Lachnospiraceae bacterium]|nr:serine/threonine protein kinase [Lachnospiraceae bacterium]